MRSFDTYKPVLQALMAAALFGASAPIAKLLLGRVEPVFLAGLLYLGSGIGLMLTRYVSSAIGRGSDAEASLGRPDIPRVIGATITGGIAAPIALMLGLRHTPAATASLLLNFEAVSTALIAGLVFKEAIGRRVWLAIACITVAGAILSVDANARWGMSIGAIGVLTACILWGVDNNITNTISGKDPLAIVTIKSLGAGIFSVLLALALQSHIPSITTALGAMMLGYVTYGLSIVLFILAMRGLGAARASTLFGTAPFVGAALSFVIFLSVPGLRFFIALPLMLTGAAMLLRDEHSHEHVHYMSHEHRHLHNDGHHDHEHSGMDPDEPHSHQHTHNGTYHNHPHNPDLHHRHEHN